MVGQSSPFGPHGHFQQHPIVIVIFGSFSPVMPYIKRFNNFVIFNNS